MKFAPADVPPTKKPFPKIDIEFELRLRFRYMGYHVPAVFTPRREWVFRRESVCYAQYSGINFPREGAARPIIYIKAAGHETAAVHVHE